MHSWFGWFSLKNDKLVLLQSTRFVNSWLCCVVARMSIVGIHYVNTAYVSARSLGDLGVWLYVVLQRCAGGVTMFDVKVFRIGSRT